MTKEKAIELLHANMQNTNLRRHCYGVSFALGAIYDYLKQQNRLENNTPDRETWEVLGILHDSDYEQTKNDTSQHTLVTLSWLDKEGVSKENALYKAIQSHNHKILNIRKPTTQMEWALECVDELTGFIVAVALVMPNKKLSEVSVENVQKKWKQKAFAAAVEREQIEQCAEKLGISLNDFIQITLSGMQQHSDELGL